MNEEVPPIENNEDLEEVNLNDLIRQMDHTLQYGTNEDLLSLFDKGMKIDQTDFEGRTALHLMSFKGKKDIVEELISRGANVNAVFMYQGRLPKTALDAAKEARKNEVVDILLANGAKTGEELQQS